MVEAELLTIIGNYGFPIFITVWFMFRTEKVISRNTEATLQLKDMVENLCNNHK